MTHFEALMIMLTREGIPFKVAVQPYYGTPQILILDADGEVVGDVICHSYSYGGADGLLELMGCGTERLEEGVLGWLTASRACFLVKEFFGKI